MAKPMNDAKSRRDFVRRNHTCVVSYARKTAPPSMSIVHYAVDGDDIVFLTMAERQKAKAVQRLGQLSVCILAGEPGGLLLGGLQLGLDLGSPLLLGRLLGTHHFQVCRQRCGFVRAQVVEVRHDGSP